MRDVLKIWFHALSAIVVGAWASTAVYNAGKAIAEVTAVKRTNVVLEWLGSWCARADVSIFYEGSVAVTAVILLLPLEKWLPRGRLVEGWRGWFRIRGGEWQVGAVGLVVAAGSLGFVAAGLLLAGAFHWQPVGTWRDWLLVGLIGVGFATVQEVVFRGMIQGVFTKVMKPGAAIATGALLFAMVHFMMSLNEIRAETLDADLPGVGLTLLEMMALRFGDWRAVVEDFLPVLAMGVVLGYAAWRTSSLWLPTGLSAGWMVCTGVFNRLAEPAERSPVACLFSGESLGEGMIPLMGILMVAVWVYYFPISPTHGSAEAH